MFWAGKIVSLKFSKARWKNIGTASLIIEYRNTNGSKTIGSRRLRKSSFIRSWLLRDTRNVAFCSNVYFLLSVRGSGGKRAGAPIFAYELSSIQRLINVSRIIQEISFKYFCFSGANESDTSRIIDDEAEGETLDSAAKPWWLKVHETLSIHSLRLNNY